MKAKQVTIKDIAKKLGISHSTVSRALSSSASYLVNDNTRRLVKQTAEELEYTPNLMAQGFVTGKTGTLGLLTYQIELETFGKLTHHILREAGSDQYQLLIGMTNKRNVENSQAVQDLQIRQLISRGVDGLLINTRGEREESEHINDSVRGRVPVVTYHYPIESASGVILDQVSDYYNATVHLIEKGHRRIGFVGMGPDETRPVSIKAKGYLKAMREHDLPFEYIESLGIHSKGGYIQGKNIGDRFTAFVCRDDYTAIGLCRGLRDSGLRVPEDVAVVGHGNLDIAAYLTPSLTTNATPFQDIARAAIDLMLRQLGGAPPGERVTVRSRLVVRESCGGILQ